MRATLAYTTARILLFVAAVGLIYLAGARGLLLFGLALLVSGAASYILLSRQRDAMAGALGRRRCCGTPSNVSKACSKSVRPGFDDSATEIVTKCPSTTGTRLQCALTLAASERM